MGRFDLETLTAEIMRQGHDPEVELRLHVKSWKALSDEERAELLDHIRSLIDGPDGDGWSADVIPSIVVAAG